MILVPTDGIQNVKFGKLNRLIVGMHYDKECKKLLYGSYLK